MRNRLIVWGGGHGDYGGNEIYAITLQPPSVARITNQSSPASSGNPDALPDGNPSSRHTYDGLAYIEHADRMFSFGGSVAPGGNCTNSTWTFNFATLVWQQMNPTNQSSLAGTCGAASAYDPNTDKVYVLARGSFTFAAYTLETNSYQILNTGSNVQFPLYAVATIDTKRQLFVLIGSGVVRTASIAAGGSFQFTDRSTTGDQGVVNASAPGIAYDPISDRIVGYTGAGNTVHFLNLDTNTWTTQTFTGGPGAASSGHAPGANPLFGRFEYFPFLGVFATVNDVDNNAFTLRVNEFAGGLPIPSAQDERDTYTSRGWTWSASAEPNFTADPNFSVSDPDIHGDMEADDLWNNLQAYGRWVQDRYRYRMEGWARYYKDDFNQCVGTPSLTLCSDESSFSLDHIQGWGLVDYFLLTGSSAHLAAAEALAARSENFWNNHPSGRKPIPGVDEAIGSSPRRIGRHLLLLTRVAEVTGSARWIAHRDYLLNLVLQTTEWNAQYGFYNIQPSTTDAVVANCQAGGQLQSYATGARVTHSFGMSILVEAFWHVWRTTGNATVRSRLIAMANFVNQYGVHPSYSYAGQYYGVVAGQAWQQSTSTANNCFGATGTWNTAYTTSLVNTLVYGYKLGGNPALLTKAFQILGCGLRGGGSGTTTACNLSATTIPHLADTILSSDPDYFAFNKGEFQYVYKIFENGGNPTLELGGNPPAAPATLRIQ